MLEMSKCRDNKIFLVKWNVQNSSPSAFKWNGNLTGWWSLCERCCRSFPVWNWYDNGCDYDDDGLMVSKDLKK